MSSASEPTRAAARRSAAWFGAGGKDGFIHRSWVRAEGFTPEVFDGRPVIGIANSFSELTPCNSHLRRASRGSETRRLASGWVPSRVPHDVTWRDADPTDRDALQEPDGDGGRRVFARQPPRRRRAPLRM